MAPREYRHVLEDIREAIAEIERATAGKTFAEFQADWLLRHGVQRGIEIISEASRGIPEHLQQLRPEIPWATVRGIGNVLRHEYHRVVDGVVWAVVTDDLPPLKAAIEAIQAATAGEG